MCSEFSDMEIKEAIFSIPNFKSPGPDDFNSGFYEATWQKLGPLVCAAVKEFFTKGIMPSYISKTKPFLSSYVKESRRCCLPL